VKCAKMAKPIQMPFGLWTRVGPRKRVLDRGPDLPCKGPIFRGKDMPDDTAKICGKIAEMIQIPFGLWTRKGRRKHVLHGGTLAQPGEYD